MTDAGTAQAHLLLRELRTQIDVISDKLEAAEHRNRRAQARGTLRRDNSASELRRELYEAYQLIDGLHRRYPLTAPERQRTG